MKPEERTEARRLRSEQGMTLRAIAEQLGVSKASVSLWVRDIELTPAQEAALLAQNPVRNGQLLGMRVRRERCREQRIAAQLHGRELARRGDAEHVAGCMLYWAEGSKTRNAAQLVNADADLIGKFLAFLRSCYDVADDRIAFSVNCFLGNGLPSTRSSTGGSLGLGSPRAAYERPWSTVRRRPRSASKGHILPYGTARIAVHSTFIVQSIYGAIQEYAGIDRPEWLDL